MKKSVIAVLVGFASAAVFAGMNNVFVTFSTPGPDRYADGTQVVDNECYALVWTPAGSTFQGINADGKAAGDSKIALLAPVAKDGKCPFISFQLDEDYVAANYQGGTWGVYMLDTRRFKTDADGVIVTDDDGNKIVESVGGSTVNGYGAVTTFADANRASASATGAVNVTTASTAPASAQDLKINDIKLIGDNVYIYVSGSLSCLQYGLQSGDTPGNLSEADGKAQYGNDNGEMIIITPKKPGAQFFKVNRK